MVYISRRLSITDEQGNQTEISDADFFSSEGPLVILGEPGAGKSELLRQFAESSGSRIYGASGVSMFPTIEPQLFPKKVLIDGLDEVTAYQPGSGITKVLEAIKNHEKPNFALTCRAVDWQSAINTKIIQDRWEQKPIVATILPMNDSEIIDFVKANGNGLDGEEFVRSAKSHDVAELLKNPQNLLMLIKAVETDGWPNSRSKLFDNACRALVSEDNQAHDSLNPNRPSQETLIEAAGFICAQLLLAGKQYVCVDGTHPESPRVNELASDEFPEPLLRSALSTKVFRTANEGLIEPCHRTIAEYLGAKWLSRAVTATLSPRRLGSLLYRANYIVPSALRGLHAWIATLCPDLTYPFIERDPYGFFRYGDPAALSVVQARHLLSNLEKVADLDPYFRSEDWHVTFGKGLAKPDLREDILRVIRSSSNRSYLSHLILESIRGDDFVLTITEDLTELLCSTTSSAMERHAALAALQECNSPPEWKLVAARLRDLGDYDSLRLALEIIEENGSVFDGKMIAEVLIGFQKTSGSDRTSSFSIGYGLAQALSLDQLDASLYTLQAHQAQAEKSVSAQRWILRLARERLLRAPQPSPDMILSWFNGIEEHDFDESNWKRFSNEHFSQNIDLRQAIQTQALSDAVSAEDFQESVFRFAHTYPGLWLRENDIVVQMHIVVGQREKHGDWTDRWACLVRYAKMHTNFTGVFLDHAKMQADRHLELRPVLEKIEQQFARNVSDEYEKREKRRDEKRKRETKARHESYKQIEGELKNGNHLSAARDIAKAYLGLFSDFDQSLAPEDRVAALVGPDLQKTALDSLAATISKNEIPTARQINNLHANEGKEYLLEYVLVVQAHLSFRVDPTLSDIPAAVARSMLAACRWGLYSSEGINTELQERLEKIVFADHESKENFLRDSMEPYLNVGAPHVSGLYQLARDAEFSDVAGHLSIEWIARFDKMSNDSLEELLSAAIQYAPRKELVDLVRKNVSNQTWGEDEKRRDIWFRTLFLIDFENHDKLINDYANENSNRIWPFRDIVVGETRNKQLWPRLTDEQNHFLINKFGHHWPPGDRPSGWSGNQNPWDATEFIQGRLTDLATSLSDSAAKFLGELIAQEGLTGFRDYTKHLLAQQTRRRAESGKPLPTLSGVRQVLLESSPASHEDLQALLLDQLEGLQDRLKHGSTNDVDAFWDTDGPREENYCRDRITSYIEPFVGRCGVRVHAEGTMPANERCDLLGTHEEINLPMEIKGQWHPDLWTAANDQLGNYTKEHRAKGWGIYLILWFGYLGPNNSKNPRGRKGHAPIRTIDDLKKMVQKCYPQISERTKIFILDLSKNKSDQPEGDQ